MYRVSNSENIKNNHRKSMIIAIALVMIIVCVGATIAYLSHTTSEVKNTFTPASVTSEITEEFDDGQKSSAVVKNTGTTAAYIRAAIVANSVNDAGNVVGPADVSECLCGDDWVKNGDYYYYTKPVKPEDITSNLLKENISLEGTKVTILAEAIQSKPADAAIEAWGVNPANLKDE